MRNFILYTIAFILLAILLDGCASDYAHYEKIKIAQANAEAERWKALADIGRNGSDTAKVAAAMGLALNGGGAGSSPTFAPKSASESILQWLGVILPTAVQAYGININGQTARAQSDNARQVAISTNETFSAMAGQIQAPAPSYTITGSGVIGAGTYNAIGGNGAIGGDFGNVGATGAGIGDYTIPTDNHAITTTTTTTNSNNPTCTTGNC